MRTCGPSAVMAMVCSTRRRGIAAAQIGEMTDPAEGRVLVHLDAREEAVRRLDPDELYRILEAQP